MWAFEFIRRVLSYKGNCVLAQLQDPDREPAQHAAVAQFAKHCHLYRSGYDKVQFATATITALTSKLLGDGINLDDDDLSGFFCSEFTAEAIKRAALNHSGGGAYAERWAESKAVLTSKISPADLVAGIPVVGPSQRMLKRQLDPKLKPITTKEQARLQVPELPLTFEGTLRLHIKEGRKADGRDWKLDPYLVCNIGDQLPAVTKVMQDRANPKWHATLLLNVFDLDAELAIACYGSDEQSDKRSPEARDGDVMIGQAAPKVSALADLPKGEVLELELVGADGKQAYNLFCEATYVPSSAVAQ